MKKKRPEYFTIIRKYLSHLNRQNISFASSEWVEKTSSKSCWAWLKVGHSTVGVIDVTGATSTIRGELVDVRQCHCAQWNIHRSALRPSFWLPGWLALIFLRLYTPLTIKRTYWAAHATEGHVAMEVWRWYWIRTGYLQAKQPPLPTKKHPLVTSYLAQHQKRRCPHTVERCHTAVKVSCELGSTFGNH